jgi:hypothetical protein
MNCYECVLWALYFKLLQLQLMEQRVFLNYNRGLHLTRYVISYVSVMKLLYFIEYSVHFFYMENDAEIFPAHFTWKVAEKRFKMASRTNLQ